MKKGSFFKRISRSLGPGFITGAADDDPSGIATYSQTGAMFGYGQLWTLLFAFPFMTAMQEMCGRIGMVSGKGLARVIKDQYSKKILFFSVLLLLFANVINIGADLGAMASALQLVLPVPFYLLLAGITAFTLLVEIIVPYPTYVKFLKYLTLSLFAYIAVAFFVQQDWGRVLASTLIPNIRFSSEYIMNIAAILGTTISPYLFFWQADEEVEEDIARGQLKEMGKGTPSISNADVKQMRADTFVGMFFSQLVAFFIMLSVAATLGIDGGHTIETASDAAQALRPVAGNFAFILFTVGIIGTGLLAVPILAGSASYAVSEAFGWKVGLNKNFRKATGFYAVIAVATIVGLLVNVTSISPMTMLYYSAVLNGVLAPPLMILILLIANNKKVLGNRTNTKYSNIFGIMITVIMSLVSLSFLYTIFFN